MNIMLNLFTTFFKIGLFSFGGGYAMLPLIKQEVVVDNAWITASDFTNLIAISQGTPGPIAINSATYIGYKVAGIFGSILSTIGICLPSFIIMIIFTKFFVKFRNNDLMENAFKGLRPTVVGLMAAAAILVGQGSFIDYKSYLIFSAVFILNFLFETDPILLTIFSGVLGILLY